MKLADEQIQGKRVVFTRNSFLGDGIVVGEEDGMIMVAINVRISSPQTYAHFKIEELTVKNI